MHKHFLRIFKFAFAAFGLSWMMFIGQTAWAQSAPDVLISRVQVRDVATDSSTNSSSEFIEVANNSSSTVDITGWCLKYASTDSPDSFRLLGCFAPNGDNGHVLLPEHGRAIIATTEYLQLHNQADGYDFIFKASLSNTAGYIALFNQSNEQADRIGWGIGPDLVGGDSGVGSNVIERIELGDGQLQWTGSAANDFRLVSPAPNYRSSAQYVFDLCLNLAGIQTEVPPEHSSDEKGNCSPLSVDVCLNIDGVQLALPQGDTVDEAGNCHPVDEGGNQPPDGGGEVADGDHALVPVELSEILPNPSGADSGHEFIELYNPNSTEIGLNGYQLFVDENLAVSFDKELIVAGGYMVLTNDNYSFTMVNSAGQVRLLLNGSLVDSSSYLSPKDGLSWAKVSGVWQYTNQVTPGASNLASLIAGNNETATLAGDLQPCPEGQERNAVTNRCRKIAVVETPSPCPAGQYRNPDTGRCKSLLATNTNSLTPCDPGQERNPETNRCRAIAVATTELAPCKPGQERNPETNRCRNVQAMTTADYAVAGAKTEKTAGSKLSWWLIGGVLAFGAVYAVFEWRGEIVALFRRLGAWKWHRK